jgi:hypothetical protein
MNKMSIFKNTVSSDCEKCACTGLRKTDVQEILELCYVAPLGFYSLGPNYQCVPEWLEEASCNS